MKKLMTIIVPLALIVCFGIQGGLFAEDRVERYSVTVSYRNDGKIECEAERKGSKISPDPLDSGAADPTAFLKWAEVTVGGNKSSDFDCWDLCYCYNNCAANCGEGNLFDPEARMKCENDCEFACFHGEDVDYDSCDCDDCEDNSCVTDGGTYQPAVKSA